MAHTLQPPIGTTGLAPAPAAPATEQLAEIASDISSDAGTLLEKHVDLLRAEMATGIAEAKGGIVLAAIGAGWVAAGGVFLLVAAVKLIGYFFPDLPEWSHWLIGGGAFLVLGAVLAYVGYRMITRADLIPHRTLHNIQETWQWIVNRRP